MYCTIQFSKKINCSEYAYLQHLFNEELNYKYSINNRVSFRDTYNYKNFEFRLFEDKLTGNGSITKLCLGNNIDNTSFSEDKNALEEIEDFLKISLSEAIIKRIDVAVTLKVSEKPNRYLQMISTPTGFYPKIFGHFDTLYFEKGNITYSFYDKNLEAFTKRKYKDLCKNDDYKLRYEVQISKPGKVLGKLYLTWLDLCNKEVYGQLADYWYNSFQSISIICNESFSDINFKNLKTLKNNLELCGVAKFGGVEVIRQIVKISDIDKSSRFYINKYLNELSIPVSPKNALKDELDKRILEAYQLYRL